MIHRIGPILPIGAVVIGAWQSVKRERALGHRQTLPLLLLWIFIAGAAPAAAQMPFVTDDADVTARGHIHFESFDEFDWLQSGRAPHLRQNTINGKLNAGLGSGFEADLDAPLITIYNGAASIPRQPFGLGDTEFGIKWNFREAPDDSLGGGSALAAAFYVEVPTGAAATGLGSGLTDTWLYVVAQRSLGHDVTIHGNLGYLVTGNPATGAVGLTSSGHVATVSASVTRQFSKAVNLGVEIAGAVADGRAQDHAQLQAIAGGSYAFNDTFAVALGLVGGHFVAAPRYGIQLGFSVDR